MMETFAKPLLQSNLSIQKLLDLAIANGEGVLCRNGALSVTTGKRTGRSPLDRYLVKDKHTADQIDWGTVNQPIEASAFDALWEKAYNYLATKDGYVSDLYVGAHPQHALKLRVITERARDTLFAKHMFVRDFNGQAVDDSRMPVWTILSTPGLATDPSEDGVHSDGVVMINITARKVLLVGMPYAGEMKKAMFTVLNYFLPTQDVLPMHCAANADADGDNVALFFGLSGTGKTTLSSDSERFLIGDDEHGWSSQEAFNFEGGCYAKCNDLSAEREPVIMAAIKDGALMENVVLDSDGNPDYADGRYTQNTRAAYPLTHVSKRIIASRGSVPGAVIFLTCDMSGVLPPLSKLNKEQAAYYFLSGYTALVGSTEMGQSAAIKSTFSTCFGAPFFPRPAAVYADLLMRRMEEQKTPVYLVNTGWTGGSFGEGGERFSIPTTRAVVRSVIAGSAEFKETLPGFGFDYASFVPGVDSKYLDPRKVWVSEQAYAEKANALIDLFQKNFQRFDVSEAVSHAGPKAYPAFES